LETRHARLAFDELADKLNHPLLELVRLDLVADNVVHDVNERRDVLLEHRSPVRACLLHAWQAHAAFGVRWFRCFLCKPRATSA
jgi:hypothetical protein